MGADDRRPLGPAVRRALAETLGVYRRSTRAGRPASLPNLVRFCRRRLFDGDGVPSPADLVAADRAVRSTCAGRATRRASPSPSP